jgi:GalNAc5-diNAcBac-PP-undecaprenol beta-1,3-glucosyltransferase
MNSKVSIIMATYNRAHFIVETLQSIQNQTYKQWECLIIDDDGTDNTLEVIRPYLQDDYRFQFLKRPEKYKKGISGCRNYGLDLAKGEHVIFFDDDDIIHPNNLATCMEVFETNNIDFCHYQKRSFIAQKPPIKIESFVIKESQTKLDIEKVVTQKIGLASCTVMWKKHCFGTCRFNENLLYAEEWECYSRLMMEDFKGVIIDNVLYYNRKHSNSNTGEYFRNNPNRTASKKEAVRLITDNLVSKNLLTPNLIKYLAGLAIGFRDTKLLNDIFTISKVNNSNKLFLQVKYWLFPIWKVYKRIGKKIKPNK